MSGLAGELCTKRYREHKHPCNKCPIREACHSGTGVLTWDSFKAWQDRCEDAARKETETVDVPEELVK